jgi:hypothetical protein
MDFCIDLSLNYRIFVELKNFAGLLTYISALTGLLEDLIDSSLLSCGS